MKKNFFLLHYVNGLDPCIHNVNKKNEGKSIKLKLEKFDI